MMRTVYGDHERFEKTYFSKFPGYYMSGDGAKRDKVSQQGTIYLIIIMRSWNDPECEITRPPWEKGQP